MSQNKGKSSRRITPTEFFEALETVCSDREFHSAMDISKELKCAPLVAREWLLKLKEWNKCLEDLIITFDKGTKVALRVRVERARK